MYLSNIGSVFMIEQQQKLVLSPYMEIYELVIPKDNLLRQIKELVDLRIYFYWKDDRIANGKKVLIGRIGRHPWSK